MKNRKKIFALALAAAMLLSLTACGSFESKLANAVKKANEVQSLHMDMEMELSIAISLLGESMDMGLDMGMNMGMDMQREPMIAKMDATVVVLGETVTIQSYIEQNGEEYVVYTSEDGSSWTKLEMTADEIPSQVGGMGAGDLQLFLNCAKNFEEAGEETVLGSAAVRYDGVIDGEYVTKAMEMTGAWEMLEESMGTAFDPSGLEDMGSIPASLWIDKKSGMITRYDMDMTEAMHALTANLIDSIMEKAGLGDFGIELEIEVSHVTVSAVLSNFNSVGEIVIPDAAKAA